jgi:hypothetical protein
MDDAGLTVQRCGSCGATYFPPRLRCRTCGRGEWEDQKVSGGRVQAVTFLRGVAGRVAEADDDVALVSVKTDVGLVVIARAGAPCARGDQVRLASPGGILTAEPLLG